MNKEVGIGYREMVMFILGATESEMQLLDMLIRAIKQCDQNRSVSFVSTAFNQSSSETSISAFDAVFDLCEQLLLVAVQNFGDVVVEDDVLPKFDIQICYENSNRQGKARLCNCTIPGFIEAVESGENVKTRILNGLKELLALS